MRASLLSPGAETQSAYQIMHQREGRRKVQKDLLFGAAAALSAAPRVCFPPRLALKLKGQQVWWDSTWLSLKAPWSARRFRSRSSIERSFIFHKMALRSLAGRLLNILIMRAQRPSSLNGYTLSDHLQENTLLVESWILKERISYRKSADELHSRLTELLSFFPSLQTLGRLGRISVRTLAHRYFHVLSRVGSSSKSSHWNRCHRRRGSCGRFTLDYILCSFDFGGAKLLQWTTPPASRSLGCATIGIFAWKGAWNCLLWIRGKLGQN